MKSIWEKENLEEIVKSSSSVREVLEKMGLRSAGGNFRTLKKYTSLYQIDTSHFVKKHEEMVKRMKTKKVNLADVMVENSSFSRTYLKERMYEEGLKLRVCEICGQGEIWNGKKMSLILDHINGIHNDNRLENLRIVCPNCNATLETHCGKNKFQKKKENKKKIPRPERRKVDRPPLEVLKKEVAENGYSATGRKYNVSDNAIRKWIKYYLTNTTG